MPIYEYVCDDCGEQYERLVMKGNTKIECPKCSSAKQTQQLSAFASRTKSSSGSSGPAPHWGGCHNCNHHH